MRKVLWLGCLVSSSVFAVEAVPSPIANRYSLVGIISETKSNAAGIAVLRDEENQRTVTLRSGEFLPGNTAFQLHTVEKGQVILTDGDANIALTFGGRSKDSQDTEEAAAEEAAELVAAIARAEKDEAENAEIPARAESLSRIIWPGNNDTVTFEEIEAYNKLMLKQLSLKGIESGDSEEMQDNTVSDFASSGH